VTRRVLLRQKPHLVARQVADAGAQRLVPSRGAVDERLRSMLQVSPCLERRSLHRTEAPRLVSSMSAAAEHPAMQFCMRLLPLTGACRGEVGAKGYARDWAGSGWSPGRGRWCLPARRRRQSSPAATARWSTRETRPCGYCFCGHARHQDGKRATQRPHAAMEASREFLRFMPQSRDWHQCWMAAKQRRTLRRQYTTPLLLKMLPHCRQCARVGEQKGRRAAVAPQTREPSWRCRWPRPAAGCSDR